jgi:lipopolysaccharide export system protein LptA
MRLLLALLLLVPALVQGDEPPAPAAEVPRPEETAPAPDVKERAAERLGLRVDEGVPIDISSDELEAIRDPEGAERVIFRGNVRVVQGTLNMRADRIEAVYRKDSSGRPGRIEATRNVRIEQDGATAECARAVFDESAGEITCTHPDGQATLRRDGDVVRGERIVFDLRNGVLKVRGRARVHIKPRERDKDAHDMQKAPKSAGEAGG